MEVGEVSKSRSIEVSRGSLPSSFSLVDFPLGQLRDPVPFPFSPRQIGGDW